MSNELVDGLDSDVELGPNDMVIVDQVDEVVDNALIKGEVSEIFSYASALKRNMQVSGLALAKLLSRLHESWEVFGVEDDFYNVVYAEIGVSKSTAYKYINMWESIFNNPQISDVVKESLRGKPIKGLILLSGVANEQPDTFDWDTAINAANASEIRQVVRSARGARTSSGTALVFSVDVVSGVLTCRQGDKEVTLGFVLNESQRKLDPLATAAFNVLISRLGALEV